MMPGEMQEQEAIDLLEARVEAGGNLVAAGQAALSSIKKLRDQLLEADIPSMLGPCAPGG